MIKVTLISAKTNQKFDEIVCSDDYCLVGKTDQSHVKLKGFRIAKQHAVIELRAAGVYITPVAKVLVNGTEITEAYGPITTSDHLQIHDYQLSILGIADSKQVEPLEQSLPATTAINLSQQNNRQSSEFLNIMRQALLQQIDQRRIDTQSLSDAELEFTLKELIQELFTTQSFPCPDFSSEEKITQLLLDEMIRLGPLESLLNDASISEIMVNAADEIFFEQDGQLFQSDVSFSSNTAVLHVIEKIVSRVDRSIDASSPMVDARLKDGSRVNAVIPPLALKGPTITIRKFLRTKLCAEQLLQFDSASQAMIDFLELAVKYKYNIIVSGGTGSGKTTTLNMLASFIPLSERLITIEDVAELKLDQANLVSLEAVPANQEGMGEITIRQLVCNSLRMRPDRIIVGECRGGEALDMLQAMNTGHDGSLSTVHANTPWDCISRLETLTLMAGMDLPAKVIRKQIASAVNIIVQQTRLSCGARKITDICEVMSLEGEEVQLSHIFNFKRQGFNEEGKTQGRFVASGIVPQLYEDLEQRGINVDLAIFKEPPS